MPRVTEAHRVARRDQILLAAARCVAREGFHRTTMAAVIAEAGLSAGAVYGYFRSKTELIRAIADEALGQAAGNLADLAVRAEPVHVSDAVQVFLEEVVNGDNPIDVPRLAVQAWAEAARDPEVAALARDKMTAVRDGLRQVVVRCQADGTLPPEADPDRLAQVLLSLLPGFVLQRLVLGDISVPSYVQSVRDLLG